MSHIIRLKFKIKSFVFLFVEIGDGPRTIFHSLSTGGGYCQQKWYPVGQDRFPVRPDQLPDTLAAAAGQNRLSQRAGQLPGGAPWIM